MTKLFKCKAQYIDDCGFISFTPEKDYVFVDDSWNRMTMIDNYERTIRIDLNIFYDYFYTEAQVKAIKRREIIAKLNNS